MFRCANAGRPIVSLLALCVAALSQMNVAEMAGVVYDASGGAIAHADVSAINAETRVKFSSVTDNSGHFQLAQLPPGGYSLTVHAEGFEEAVVEHLTLHAGEHAGQSFTLTVGQKMQVLVVEEGAAGLFETESAQLRDVIENQQVVNLPVKDREFLELAMLGPGVVNPPGGTRGDSLQQTGKLINILGQRTGHNLFLVDGVSVTDQYYNNVVLNPSPDNTREFNVAKANYDAEFGGKSGGVINVITQSGNNLFHGRAYEFLRNNILDARNFFDPGSAPAFHENQFGGAFGGPVLKEKTFFYLAFDGQRIRDSVANVFSVPTAGERQGVLSGALLNPLTHQPFPGNRINLPLDAAAVALLARVPLPNLPGTANNLRAVEKQRIDTNQYNARIDHRFSDLDSAWVRGSIFEAKESDPFGSSVLNEALLPGFGRNLNTHSNNVAAGETHVFSPSVVNEFRFGWLRVSGGQGNPNAGNLFAREYGLAGTTPNSKDMGFPQIALSNQFTTLGDAAGFTSRIDRNYELYDNVAIQRGAHSIKFGGYLFRLNFNPSYPNNARGLYTFNGAYSGNPLADFLLGYPSQAQVGIGDGAENAHTNWAHFYVEDGWKPTPSLKVDFGLRYEFNQNLLARPNQTSNIDLDAPGGPVFVVSGNTASLPPTAAALAAVSPIPIASASSVGWNDSLLKPKNVRLSPRVGLAWTIPGSEKTVLRAGFGIYTNQAAYSILQNLAENVPFYLLKTVANTTGRPLYSTENILTANPTGAVGANGVNNGFAIEYNEVWNAAIQRQLGAGTAVEANYIGSRTVHADSATAVNVPETFGGPRPFPLLNAYTTIRWDGSATFHGLSLRATRRFTRHLSFDVSYTRSKSMDDGSDTGTTNAEYNLPQNPYAMRLEKGLSSFDHRNRFIGNAIYDLPFGNPSSGLLSRVIANWRISGIVTIQSGAPFTVNLSSATGQDVAHIGLVGSNNLERPDLISNPNAGGGSPTHWFNPAAFVLPESNSFGNAGRNIVVGPGLSGLDLSLQKEEVLHDRTRAQFRIDVYNSLNHANFALPGRIFGASNFGVITSAGDSRQVQVALKLTF